MAGTSYPACSIQITGSGFGTNPVLSIVSADGGTEIASYSICGGSSDGLITATVQTNTRYVQGAVNVTVTSQGYSGYGGGFVSGQGDSSGSNVETVEVEPQTLPALQIMFNGQNIANNTASPAAVIVGQQIALTATITQGGNQITPDSQQWSRPLGNVIANFVASKQSGAVIPLPNPNGTPSDCQSSLIQNCLNFYWVDQGNGRTVTYTSTIGGKPGPTATMTFNVTGPTNVTVSAPTGVVGIQASPLALAFGVGDNIGIDFTVSATPPSRNQGAYSWVQLVLSYTQNYVTSNLGVRYCVNPAFSSDKSPALDTGYPTDTGPEANDSPGVPLQASTPTNGNIGEISGSGKFTMYSMWTPNAAGGCTGGAACTVPVPLGTVSWQFAGDAINTLAPQTSNGTNWTVAPPGCASPNAVGTAPFSPGTLYPQWNRPSDTSGSLTCHN